MEILDNAGTVPLKFLLSTMSAQIIFLIQANGGKQRRQMGREEVSHYSVYFVMNTITNAPLSPVAPSSSFSPLCPHNITLILILSLDRLPANHLGPRQSFYAIPGMNGTRSPPHPPSILSVATLYSCSTSSRVTRGRILPSLSLLCVGNLQILSCLFLNLCIRKRVVRHRSG